MTVEYARLTRCDRFRVCAPGSKLDVTLELSRALLGGGLVLVALLRELRDALVGTLAGRLERMMEPLISTVNEWRAPLEDMLVLLCRKLAHVLGREVDPIVRWPRVIAVTPADLAAAATALSTATGGQAVMSRETGAKLFAQLAEIEDVEEELKKLDADADDAMDRAKRMLTPKEPVTKAA